MDTGSELDNHEPGVAIEIWNNYVCVVLLIVMN